MEKYCCRSIRPREVVERFEAAQSRRPRRAASLLGAARAHAQLGDQDTAAAFYAELVDIWSVADSGHPGLDEARRYENQ